MHLSKQGRDEYSPQAAHTHDSPAHKRIQREALVSHPKLLSAAPEPCLPSIQRSAHTVGGTKKSSEHNPASTEKASTHKLLAHNIKRTRACQHRESKHTQAGST